MERNMDLVNYLKTFLEVSQMEIERRGHEIKNLRKVKQF